MCYVYCSAWAVMFQVCVVLELGGRYLWLCGIVSGSISNGFELAVRFGLGCIFVLHPSLGEWDLSFLLGAARMAVTSGLGKP